jgi:hypothetical protein
LKYRITALKMLPTLQNSLTRQHHPRTHTARRVTLNRPRNEVDEFPAGIVHNCTCPYPSYLDLPASCTPHPHSLQISLASAEDEEEHHRRWAAEGVALCRYAMLSLDAFRDLPMGQRGRRVVRRLWAVAEGPVCARSTSGTWPNTSPAPRWRSSAPPVASPTSPSRPAR